MENYEIAEVLTLTAKLMELHGENAFKARSFQNAAFKIDRLQELLRDKSQAELAGVDGIGSSLSKKIYDLIHKGKLEDLEDLLNRTPQGVLDIMRIKGLGPKKVGVLWKELGVESPGELLYACNENRLLDLKGFGAKTQQQIINAIEFKNSQAGKFHYPDAEAVSTILREWFAANAPGIAIEETGDLRRRCEIIITADFITAGLSENDNLFEQLTEEGFSKTESTEDILTLTSPSGIPVRLFLSTAKDFVYRRWITTGSDEHLKALNTDLNAKSLMNSKDEHAIYSELGLHYIEPELREGINEIEVASSAGFPPLVTWHDLKGILHNHTNWSDGVHTLREMAEGCRDLGFSYLGVCDHSKTAFYANGLTVEKVKQQQEAIDQLNSELLPFRVFKGIESDILPDGSLDYDEDVLESFDFIVASVHSGLKMDVDKATQRLLKAIRNPYTTILGHATGRLLLARAGYPIDHKAIIDACSEEGVVIELNANPYRLDMDWHWISYALSKNVMISINPDAHSIDGYYDMHYGVNAARKGGLPAEMTFNAKGTEFIAGWFDKRRKRRIDLKAAGKTLML